MAEITTALIKELRDATGISILKCKNALDKAEGDLEKAREILRRQGESDASKKADRAASEGVITAMTTDDGKKAALAQVYCETDFVARGDDFQQLASELVKLALDKGIEATKAEGEELIKTAIQKIGENIRLGDIKVEEAADGVIGSYIHGNQKIGVLVTLKSGSEEVAKDIAMQVAAMNPSILLPEDVSDEDVAKEKDIQSELLTKEGKPADIIEKILEGKIRKFREGQSLVKQAFVKDPSKTIEDLLKEMDAEIEHFTRLAI